MTQASPPALPERDAGIAGNTAARLKEAFDQSFAAIPPVTDADAESLLGIAIRGEPYAVRLREVTAVLADLRVVALPGPSRELLGLTGVRGTVVPVYDLGALLGHPPLAAPARFLLVVGEAHPVGFSFEGFDGYVRVPRSQISSPEDETRSHCREVAKVGTEARAIILLASILGTITERVAAMRATGER